MKPCKTYEQDLLLLAHGQLDASDAARTRQHLSICAPCEARLTQLAGVSLLLADAVYSTPTVPIVGVPLRSSFLPAKQQWLLSAFLGGCILFALLSMVKTAQSYASPIPGIARILPFASAPVPFDRLTAPPCDEPKSALVKPHKYQKATKSHRVPFTAPSSNL